MNQEPVPKPNVVEMAKKVRHIKLIEKIQKKTISRPEVEELKKYEADPKSPGVVDTQDQVAAAFEVNVRTVQNWVRDGMPIMNDGRYDIKEIQAWRFVRRGKKTAERMDDDDPEKKYRDIKYRRELLKLQLEEGEVLRIEDVEEQLIAISIAVKQKLLAFPKKMIHLLHGQDKKEMQVILTQKVKELITEFETGRIFASVTNDHIKKVRKTQKSDQGTFLME